MINDAVAKRAKAYWLLDERREARRLVDAVRKKPGAGRDALGAAEAILAILAYDDRKPRLARRHAEVAARYGYPQVREAVERGAGNGGNAALMFFARGSSPRDQHGRSAGRGPGARDERGR